MSKIHSHTLAFLKQLAENNNKVWYQNHKKEFDEILEQLYIFTGAWQAGIASLEKDVLLHNPRKSVFRIYRDLRFSKDKTPFKTHFGTVVGKDGKNSDWAVWYLHLRPGNQSYLGAGKWSPNGHELHVIRQEIDYNLDEFESVLNEKVLKKNFGNLDTSDSLIRVPKGYEPDNPAIEYLKLKSFILRKNYSDKEVLSEDFLRKIIEDCTTLDPFIRFLNRALSDLY